jgi:hypothetical protein
MKDVHVNTSHKIHDYGAALGMIFILFSPHAGPH